MSTPEMDYFAQKPDLDLRAFFQGRGISMAEADEPISRIAPPPKDTYWVAEPIPDTEEE